VNIRSGEQFRPRYAGISERKEEERKRFVDFLVKTGMIDRIFSYHPLGFDSFVRRAKYDPNFKAELFELIEVVEQKPTVTVRSK